MKQFSGLLWLRVGHQTLLLEKVLTIHSNKEGSQRGQEGPEQTGLAGLPTQSVGLSSHPFGQSHFYVAACVSLNLSMKMGWITLGSLVFNLKAPV